MNAFSKFADRQALELAAVRGAEGHRPHGLVAEAAADEVELLEHLAQAQLAHRRSLSNRSAGLPAAERIGGVFMEEQQYQGGKTVIRKSKILRATVGKHYSSFRREVPWNTAC